MKYTDQAKELRAMLDADQREIKAAVRAAYAGDQQSQAMGTRLVEAVDTRTGKMLEIIGEIGEPSLSNIGTEAAQAVSILALHSSKEVLHHVLELFECLYERDKTDVYYQAIPSMVDRRCVQEGRPQRFGTQWYFDEDGQPFMTPIEDFEHVNERRAAYGIEPFRWPRSLALPESAQPWLQWPLTPAVIRQLTTREIKDLEA